MTKEQLAYVKKKVLDIKKYINTNCEKSNDTFDILKSLMILEQKCNFYIDNFDALNSHKKDSLGESEK